MDVASTNCWSLRPSNLAASAEDVDDFRRLRLIWKVRRIEMADDEVDEDDADEHEDEHEDDFDENEGEKVYEQPEIVFDEIGDDANAADAIVRCELDDLDEVELEDFGSVPVENL